MTSGVLYVSHSTNAGSAEFHSIPYHSASVDHKIIEASTMSFSSPVKLSEADRIRYHAKKDFGGQIYRIKHNAGDDYQYEAISYKRLYHDKVTCSFKNKTSSQILKKVLGLSKNNFRKNGIKKTELIHNYLKWENTSIWDIACQLAWLEYQVGFIVDTYVDADGTLVFKYRKEKQEGYNFTSVFDYSEDYDSSDIITASRGTYNGKTIANSQSSTKLVAKWGYVSEGEECQATSGGTSTTSNTNTVKTTTELKDEAQISKYNIPKSIVDQALSIAKPKNTPKQNLKLLYNWCNQHISFDPAGYYNTRYGAAGTLKRRSGNCCDNAHVLIAMARSIGIKARYCHGNNGKAGHVWGEYKINNNWFTVDTGTSSSSKYWGSHWNGAGGCVDRHDTLPF